MDWLEDLISSFFQENTNGFMNSIEFAFNKSSNFLIEIRQDFSIIDTKNKFLDQFLICFVKWLMNENRHIDFNGFSAIFDQVTKLALDENIWFLKITKFFTKKLKFYALQANNHQNKQGIFKDNFNDAVIQIR